MIGGMRLGIWVLRLLISLSCLFGYVWKGVSGCFVFIGSI